VSGWYYEVLDFRRSAAVGSLAMNLTVDDLTGSTIEHRFEVGARGDHLCLLSMVGGSRQTAVAEVFPKFLDFSASHFGVVLAQDWDGRNMVSRTIISLSPLVQVQPGPVTGPDALILDESWDAGFKAHHVMSPEAS
jgi:hypothetical protein